MMSPARKPLSDEELDARLRAVATTVPSELCGRLLDSIPDLSTRMRHAFPVRPVALAATLAVVVLIVGAVLSAPRRLSASQIMDRMAQALRGKCLVVHGADPLSRTADQNWLWIGVLENPHGSGPELGVRQHDRNLTRLHYGWLGDRLTVGNAETGIVVRSHCRDAASASRPLVGVLEQVLEMRDAHAPHIGLETLGTDRMDGQSCYVVAWHRIPREECEHEPEGMLSTVWWVNRKSHLPVAWAMPSEKDLGFITDVSEARQALRSTRSSSAHFDVAAAPAPGFFELTDLATSEVRDVRPAQQKLLNSVVTAAQTQDSVEEAVFHLAVHSIEARADGLVDILLSVRADGVPPSHRFRVEPAAAAVEWDFDDVPWTYCEMAERQRATGAERFTTNVVVPVASRQGQEYCIYCWHDPVFGRGDAEVRRLTLVPRDYGQPSLGGDGVVLPLIVQAIEPYAGLRADHRDYEADLELSISMPPPTGDSMLTHAAVNPRWEAGHTSSDAYSTALLWAGRQFLDLGRSQEACAHGRAAMHLFEAETGGSADRLNKTRWIGPALMVRICAELGDVEGVELWSRRLQDELATNDVLKSEGMQEVRQLLLDGMDQARQRVAQAEQTPTTH